MSAREAKHVNNYSYLPIVKSVAGRPTPRLPLHRERKSNDECDEYCARRQTRHCICHRRAACLRPTCGELRFQVSAGRVGTSITTSSHPDHSRLCLGGKRSSPFGTSKSDTQALYVLRRPCPSCSQCPLLACLTAKQSLPCVRACFAAQAVGMYITWVQCTRYLPVPWRGAYYLAL